MKDAKNEIIAIIVLITVFITSSVGVFAASYSYNDLNLNYNVKRFLYSSGKMAKNSL